MIPALVLAALTLGGQSIGGEPGAVLEIEAASDEVKAEGPAILHVTLANRGSRPLWLNERLGLSSPNALPSHRELTLSVVGPDGRKLLFDAKVCRDSAEAKDFRVLEPNEAVTRSLHLDRYYAFDKEGSYTVRARYADGTPQAPPAPEGAIPFRGPLSSNEIQIRIVR